MTDTPGAPRTPVAMVETMVLGEMCTTVVCDDGSVWWMSDVNEGWHANPPIPGTPAALAQEVVDEH